MPVFCGSGMTPTSFLAWRLRLGLTVKATSEALGCSRTSVHAWEKGRHEIPRYIALACQALANGLPPMN
jgi:transcriptional regulator with XRE-family HTH domain